MLVCDDDDDGETTATANGEFCGFLWSENLNGQWLVILFTLSLFKLTVCSGIISELLSNLLSGLLLLLVNFIGEE